MMKTKIFLAVLGLISVVATAAILRAGQGGPAIAAIRPIISPITSGDCMGEFEQAWPPPRFECPFGTPNPQCMADAAIAYEQYMQMASFTLCETLGDIETGYQNEIDDCLKYYNVCTSAGEGYQAYCLQQLHECVQLWVEWKSGATANAYATFYQDMADAQDAYYAAALDCCPQ